MSGERGGTNRFNVPPPAVKRMSYRKLFWKIAPAHYKVKAKRYYDSLDEEVRAYRDEFDELELSREEMKMLAIEEDPKIYLIAIGRVLITKQRFTCGLPNFKRDDVDDYGGSSCLIYDWWG